MLNDNFKVWRKFALTNTSVSDTLLPLEGSLTATSLNGVPTSGYTHILCNKDTACQALSPAYKSHIYYGSGRTPASVTDTHLESPLSPVLKVMSETTVSAEFKNHSTVLTVSSLASNVSASAVTIGELVWLKEMSLAASEGGSVTNCSVVMARHTLDEPVTLAAGESRTFNIRIII